MNSPTAATIQQSLRAKKLLKRASRPWRIETAFLSTDHFPTSLRECIALNYVLLRDQGKTHREAKEQILYRGQELTPSTAVPVWLIFLAIRLLFWLWWHYSEDSNSDPDPSPSTT